MTRDDIMEKVVEVLEDALGADPEDIVPAASLTADLDAESIDFLDIVFKLEQTFGFKVAQKVNSSPRTSPTTKNGCKGTTSPKPE